MSYPPRFVPPLFLRTNMTYDTGPLTDEPAVVLEKVGKP